jgi:hypothetical protein
MFDQIIEKLIAGIKEFATSRKKLEVLEAKVAELEAQRKSPKAVIEAILGRGIKWYDWNELAKESDKVDYYDEIQYALNNDALWNEVNHFLNDLISEVAKSDNEPHRDKLLRYSINGLDCLRERLEEIPNPQANKPDDDDEDAKHDDI